MHIRLWAISSGERLGAFQFPAAANLFDTLHPPSDGVLAKTLGHQFQGTLSTDFSAQLLDWSPQADRCAHCCFSRKARSGWGSIRLSREKNSPLRAPDPLGSGSLGKIKRVAIRTEEARWPLSTTCSRKFKTKAWTQDHRFYLPVFFFNPLAATLISFDKSKGYRK